MVKRKNKSNRCTASDVADAQRRGIIGDSSKKLSYLVWVVTAAAAFVIIHLLTSGNGDATDGELSPTGQKHAAETARQKVEESNTQQQKPGQEIIDPSAFGGSSWALVKHFSQTYDAKGLHHQLKSYFDITERAYDPSKRKVLAMAGHAGARFDRTTRHKLLHDLEQFKFFLKSDLVGLQPHGRKLFEDIIPSIYRETLKRLDEAAIRGDFDETNEYYKFIRDDESITAFYNRALFLPTLPALQGPLLNRRNWAKVESQWLGEDVSFPHPGIVVVDNLLSDQALQRVRNYLLLGTFWYEVKTPRFGQYLGAYLNDGMNDPMMPEIAYELHKSMPRVMEGHHFKEMWSYKYESASSINEERKGIHIHADDAMVNVNVWITPDEANLDKNSGGLVVYTMKPSQDLMKDFEKFNSNWEYVDEHLLRPSGYANVTIPYKQNRAVIFDSFLFHKSQPHRFKTGYENRRINLTFLYGEKQSQLMGGPDADAKEL